jgi:hypothetical protein
MCKCEDALKLETLEPQHMEAFGTVPQAGASRDFYGKMMQVLQNVGKHLPKSLNHVVKTMIIPFKNNF